MDAISQLYRNSAAGRAAANRQRNEVDGKYLNLMAQNEVTIDFTKFKLDELEDKKTFFNNLFSLASSSLEDPSYFLDFGISENILEPNEKIWLDNYISPSGSLPFDIPSSYSGFDAIYTNTNILKSRSLAMQVINHYFYDADLSDKKVLDTLKCLKEFFPTTLTELVRMEYSDTPQISLERLKQLNSVITGDRIPYIRDFSNYKKWKETLTEQARLEEIDYYLSNDALLKEGDVKSLYADYYGITGKNLTLLSNGKSREINILDAIVSSSNRGFYPHSDDTARSIMQYPGVSDYIKNITDAESLALVYGVLAKHKDINPNICLQICEQAGPKLLDNPSKLGDAQFDVSLYFYKKDMLTDKQVQKLKYNYADIIMHNKDIQDVFYQKGDTPFNVSDLGSLIEKGIFTEKDMEKNPVLRFNSDKEKALTLIYLSNCLSSDEHKKIASHYLNQYLPYDPNLWIKNMANDSYILTRFFHDNMDKFKFDTQSENACLAMVLKFNQEEPNAWCDGVLFKLIDKLNFKEYLNNNGDINALGAFICPNKNKIKNYNHIIDEIVKIKPKEVTSTALAYELGRRGFRYLSPQNFISYSTKYKSISVGNIPHPEAYDFEATFLLTLPYQHSSDSHTTFLNEMLWHEKPQETVMALNNGASPFTKAGFFRDKFTAMPFNMFFNRKLKNNETDELQSFMGYIAANLDEGKEKVLQDIWTSLGQKMRSDEKVRKIIAATDKIYKSRDFSKERLEKELAKQEQERQARLQKEREEQEAREQQEKEARIRHERDISHLTSNVLSSLGDMSDVADKDIATKIAEFLKTNKGNQQVVPALPNAEELANIMSSAVERKAEQIREREEEQARKNAEQEQHRQNILQNISQYMFNKFDTTGKLINQDELKQFMDSKLKDEDISLRQDVEKTAMADFLKQKEQYHKSKEKLRKIYYDVVANEITNINGEIHRNAGESKSSKNRIYSSLSAACEDDKILVNIYNKMDITDSSSDEAVSDLMMKNVAYIEPIVVKDIQNNNGIYNPDVCFYSSERATNKFNSNKQNIKEAKKQAQRQSCEQDNLSSGRKPANKSNNLADLAKLLSRNNSK